MELYNIYFSPTGTSAKVASSVAVGVENAAGCKHTEWDVTKSEPAVKRFSDSDILIMAAPVYGGKMAPIAKARMENLEGNDTPCILIAVYGNRAFENAISDMAEFARSRGFRPIAAGAFVGEHSYSTTEYPVAAGRPDAKDIEEARLFGKFVGDKIASGNLSEIDVSELHDEPVPESSLMNFKNFVMGYMQQQKTAPVAVLPEVDESLCTGCGECRAACPTGAIGEDCLSLDASRCIKCCACVKICPEAARALHSPFAPMLSANFSQRKNPVWIL